MRRLVLAATILAALTSTAQGRAAPGTWLHISSHLPGAAKVSIDGAPAVTAPGEGQVDAKLGAGHHTLKVTAAQGVAYVGVLDLSPSALFTFHGKSYWCVNLLDKSLEPYSKDECQEEVSYRG